MKRCFQDYNPELVKKSNTPELTIAKKGKSVGNFKTSGNHKDDIKQFQKMGPMSDIIGMMPGANKLKGLNVDEKKIIWIKFNSS